VSEESTANNAAARPTSTQSTTPKPLLASRIAPSTSGDIADRE